MESKFLLFERLDNDEKSPLRTKTGIFAVSSKDKKHILGLVKWFPRWRRYCFFPESDCSFDAACLQDITAFIDSKMQARWGWRKP